MGLKQDFNVGKTTFYSQVWFWLVAWPQRTASLTAPCPRPVPDPPKPGQSRGLAALPAPPGRLHPLNPALPQPRPPRAWLHPLVSAQMLPVTSLHLCAKLGALSEWGTELLCELGRRESHGASVSLLPACLHGPSTLTEDSSAAVFMGILPPRHMSILSSTELPGAAGASPPLPDAAPPPDPTSQSITSPTSLPGDRH